MKVDDMLRGEWCHGGWRCDCRTPGSQPWNNVKSANTGKCQRCGIYRPKKARDGNRQKAFKQ